MLTHEQCKEIVEAGLLKFQDAATLDCRINQLTLHATRQTLPLSEPQKRLLVCLFKNITCKRKIINIVWFEYHQRIGDNNYHQLVFQLRALLKQHQLPAQLVLTVPYYGVKINEPLLLSLDSGRATCADVKPQATIPPDEGTAGTERNQLIASTTALPAAAVDSYGEKQATRDHDGDNDSEQQATRDHDRNNDSEQQATRDHDGNNDSEQPTVRSSLQRACIPADLFDRLKNAGRSCFGFCLLVLV